MRIENFGSERIELLGKRKRSAKGLKRKIRAQLKKAGFRKKVKAKLRKAGVLRKLRAKLKTRKGRRKLSSIATAALPGGGLRAIIAAARKRRAKRRAKAAGIAPVGLTASMPVGSLNPPGMVASMEASTPMATMTPRQMVADMTPGEDEDEDEDEDAGEAEDEDTEGMEDMEDMGPPTGGKFNPLWLAPLAVVPFLLRGKRKAG